MLLQPQVYVKYADFNSDEVNIMPLVNYVASSFVMPAGIDGSITPDLNFMNGSWYSGFLGNNTTTGEPRAFLNSILLDNNLQVQRDEEGNPLIDIVQVSEAAKIPEDGSDSDHELLKLTVTVKKEGYIYIYLSNDDQQDMDVYFDDFKITHKLNDIVAGGDYYPFGLAMSGRQITRDDYRFGYQGQFAEKDEETGWNSFELRMYDPVVGRWLSADPARQYGSPYLAFGNNPISRMDPDGGTDGEFFYIQSNKCKCSERLADGTRVTYYSQGWEQGMLRYYSGLSWDEFNAAMHQMGDDMHAWITDLNTADDFGEIWDKLVPLGFWTNIGRGSIIDPSEPNVSPGNETLLANMTPMLLTRKPWRLTAEGSSAIRVHKSFGRFYKSKSDGTWWSVDKAGHGGSKFKVFREGRKGLEWIYDADEYGTYIHNKHKGSTGLLIPYGHLKIVK